MGVDPPPLCSDREPGLADLDPPVLGRSVPEAGASDHRPFPTIHLLQRQGACPYADSRASFRWPATPTASTPAKIVALAATVAGRRSAAGHAVADSRTAPASRDRDRRHAAQRLAAIGGAGGHDFRAGWRDDGRDALSVPSPPPAGRRGSREPEPVAAAASSPGSTSRPTTASASPVEPHRLPAERSPATAGGGRHRRSG